MRPSKTAVALREERLRQLFLNAYNPVSAGIILILKIQMKWAWVFFHLPCMGDPTSLGSFPGIKGKGRLCLSPACQVPGS